MSSGGGWAAQGGLYLSTGLFGVAMSPTSLSRGSKICFTHEGVNIYQIHTYLPFISPFV